MDSFNSENTTCSYCEIRSIDLDCCEICKTFLCEDHFEGDKYTDDVCGQCVEEQSAKYLEHVGDCLTHQLTLVKSTKETIKELKAELSVFKDAQDDAEDDYHNEDQMHYDDLPFLSVSGKPEGKVEQAYCDFTVMCIRAGIELCQPQELLRMHRSGNNWNRVNLSPDQIDVLQVIILTLDNAEATI